MIIKNDVKFESVTDIADNETSHDLCVLPEQDKRFSNTLSLLASAVIKKRNLSIIQKKIFISSLVKATVVWNKCNLRKWAKIILEICERNSVIPCIGRWNSFFDSLQYL